MPNQWPSRRAVSPVIALHDLRDAVCRHFQLASEFGRRRRKLGKLFGQDFAGMDCRSRHDAASQ